MTGRTAYPTRLRWRVLPIIAIVIMTLAAAGPTSHGQAVALAPNKIEKAQSMPASFKAFDDKAARAGEPVSVVFFGGSLTWGANASDPQTTSYRGRMMTYLQRRYPKTVLRFHDAAIGGTGSKLGLFRLQRDVLTHAPDLVFLDFTVNDNIDGDDLPTLDSYETILRELVGRGVPVVQNFFGFKNHFGATYASDTLPRLVAHRKLAAAYGTGTGDLFPVMQERLTSGGLTTKEAWPFDGAHPDDAGYAVFFDAVRDGFERAVAEGRTCVVPPEPVFGNAYKERSRIKLVDAPLPAGWSREKTFRTSLWYDGLSSRWMEDVAVFDAKQSAGSVQPLRVTFRGTMVGLFGEADQDGLSFRTTVDGKPLTHRDNAKSPETDVFTANTSRFTGGGTGRLFVWRQLSDALPPGEHVLEITPVLPEGDAGKAKGQLRIESVCAAGE